MRGLFFAERLEVEEHFHTCGICTHVPQALGGGVVTACVATTPVTHKDGNMKRMMTTPLSDDQIHRALDSTSANWCDSSGATLFDLWCRHVGIEPNTYESSIAYVAWNAARDYFLGLEKPK